MTMTDKAAQVAAGQVMVPIEPSEAMIDAFVACALQYAVSSQNGGWTAYAREQWRNMIRAHLAASGGGDAFGLPYAAGRR